MSRLKKTRGSIVRGALWQAVHYDWLDNIKALFHEVVFVCKKGALIKGYCVLLIFVKSANDNTKFGILVGP